MNKQDKIGSKINLIKLPSNTSIQFELDAEVDWVRDFLLEMNENATDSSAEE